MLGGPVFRVRTDVVSALYCRHKTRPLMQSADYKDQDGKLIELGFVRECGRECASGVAR